MAGPKGSTAEPKSPRALTSDDVCRVCNEQIVKLMDAAENTHGPESLEFERQADLVMAVRERLLAMARGEA